MIGLGGTITGLSGRIVPGAPTAYAFAAACLAGSAIAAWALGLLAGDVPAFAAFFPAVLLATLIGGAGPGAMAAVAAALLGGLVATPMPLPVLPPHADVLARVLTCLAAALAIVWGVEHYRRLALRLQDEERLRQLVLDELSHRLRNKGAALQSIVSLRLREHPVLRDDIVAALAALSATDTLIARSGGEGARLADILSSELAPYELARVSIAGPDLQLPPQLALTMALLVHELATNAAKYGALSNASGTLAVRWACTGGALKLEWRERGGPPVAPPSHHGFGSRLVKRALEPFRGQVRALFPPDGLVCDLTLPLDCLAAGKP